MYHLVLLPKGASEGFLDRLGPLNRSHLRGSDRSRRDFAAIVHTDCFPGRLADSRIQHGCLCGAESARCRGQTGQAMLISTNKPRSTVGCRLGYPAFRWCRGGVLCDEGHRSQPVGYKSFPLWELTPQCTAVLQTDFENRTDPNNKEQQQLLEEMKAHLKKVRGLLKARRSFCCALRSKIHPSPADLAVLCPRRQVISCFCCKISWRTSGKTRTLAWVSPPLSSRKPKRFLPTTSRWSAVTLVPICSSTLL